MMVDRLIRAATLLLAAIVACLGVLGVPQGTAHISAPAAIATELEVPANDPANQQLRQQGNKLDLNNSSVRSFSRLRGFYPNLASKIVANAPYDNVEDVLEIPDLSERQRERLEANMDEFTVGEPTTEYVHGFDRVNNGIY